MTHHTDAERALSSLRHLYQQMAGGQVKDSAQAKRIAEGILSPAIAKLEQAARRAAAAPQPPEAAPVRKPLTDAQIEGLLINWPKDGIAFFDFARAIERAHGIGAPS